MQNKDREVFENVQSIYNVGTLGVHGVEHLDALREYLVNRAQFQSSEEDVKKIEYAMGAITRILSENHEIGDDTRIASTIAFLMKLSTDGDDRLAHLAIYALGAAGAKAKPCLPLLSEIAATNLPDSLLALRCYQACYAIDEHSTETDTMRKIFLAHGSDIMGLWLEKNSD